MEQIDARQVSEGWNLAVLETRGRTDIIVGDEIDGIALAPPLQVYLDLMQGPSRSREMAQHFQYSAPLNFSAVSLRGSVISIN